MNLKEINICFIFPLVLFLYGRITLLLLLPNATHASVYLMAATALLTLLLVINTLLLRLKKSYLKPTDLMLFFCYIVLVIFSFRAVLSSNSLDGVIGIPNAISFLSVMGIITVSKDLCYTICIKKIIQKFVLINSVILSLLIFISSSYKSGILMIYTGNGNQCGMLYMCFFMSLFYYFTQLARKSRIRYLYIAILFLLMLGMFRTNSRTALFSCVITLLYYYSTKKSLQKSLKRYSVFFAILIFLPLIYIFLSHAINDYVVMGKPLFSGRELIWSNVLDFMLHHPFTSNFGVSVPTTNFSYYGEGLFTHNVILEVGWQYSLLAILPFLFIYFKLGKSVIEASNRSKHYCAPAIFIGTFVHLSFEASMLVNALDFSLLYLMPILLSLDQRSIHTSQLKVM